MKIEIFLIMFHGVFVSGQCWKKSYSRGIGVPVNSCGVGLEKSGLLCYEKCKDGFVGVGPVCWSKCAQNLTDIGAICWKNPHIIGKDCCCTGRTHECCGNCPEGYQDDGCTCRRNLIMDFKKSYCRGFGNVLNCSQNRVYESGLCYKKCKSGYTPIGPICYQSCKEPFPVNCGVFCGKAGKNCLEPMIGLGASVFGVLASATFNLGNLGSLAAMTTAIGTCIDLEI